jgi:hypothetical protein
MSTTDKHKLVRALAAYILTDGARIGSQQRAYDKYMGVFVSLEAKYPRIDFRSEASVQALTRAALRYAGRKLVRGPGSTC